MHAEHMKNVRGRKKTFDIRRHRVNLNSRKEVTFMAKKRAKAAKKATKKATRKKK